MKKIITPGKQEEHQYICDFSGIELSKIYEPDCTVKISFNYGSKFDGAFFELHLSDKEASELLKYIKSKLSNKTLKNLKKNIKGSLNNNDNDCLYHYFVN